MFNLNLNLNKLAQVISGTAQAIAILTLAPASRRNAEIEQAKQNIAARKAKETRIKQEVEIELVELKANIAPAPNTPVNDPWIEPIETKATTHQWRVTQNQQPPLKLLPPAPTSITTTAKPDYSKMTIRELKAIASSIKLKGYARMNKAQLAQELSQR